MNSMQNTSSVQVLKTTQSEEFDLVVLGGAMGATIAAWTFAGQGQRVAVIERKYIGESYPNIGRLLIPLFSSAASVHKVADATLPRNAA
jgi:pyruvate/2-oxoglutarate dehydrogenase complex dihydrolipoamide dehydrogenase (E3) component